MERRSGETNGESGGLDVRMYTRIVLWRRKPSSSRSTPLATRDVDCEDDARDLDNEMDRGDEHVAPAQRAKAAVAPRDVARRLDGGEVEIVIEARLEVVDERGRVVASRAVDGFPPPLIPASRPLDVAGALAAGRALRVGGLVAIDFETATGSRSSACAVGVAAVWDGQVADTKRWLIRPPGNEYAGFNIAVHGITPAMTMDSPTMGEVWPDVLAFIRDRPLVAHYAAFDMSVLRRSLMVCGSEWPDLPYFCTRALARRAWPGMVSYRLVDLADACGITFDRHEPGSDAATAAELAIACCGRADERVLADASRALGVACGRLWSDGWTPSGVVRQRLSDLSPTVERVPDHSPFVDKTVVFTGTLTCGLTRAEAAQIVVNAGGRASNSVSKKVDYLILGMQDARKVTDGSHSGKMLKAVELQQAGAPIELLSEDDFLRMLPE